MLKNLKISEKFYSEAYQVSDELQVMVGHPFGLWKSFKKMTPDKQMHHM